MNQRTVVEVVYADGSSFEESFEGDSVVVGVGPEADLQIRRAPEIQSQHLLLMPRINGVWVSAAREARVRPLVGGAHFENGLLPWGTEIDIGSVTLRPRRPAAGKRVRRWPLLLAMVPVAVIGYLTYWSQDRLPRTSAQPPPLFAEAAQPCPDLQRPHHRAAEATTLGDALEAQYAYDPQQGIRSVAEFALAEACAAYGRNGKLREEARARRLALENRINGDFSGQRVLLDRAIALDDPEGIVAAARALGVYLRHRPSEYSRWLGVIERHVAVRVESDERKREKKGTLNDPS